jgi:hypothetical protein
MLELARGAAIVDGVHAHLHVLCGCGGVSQVPSADASSSVPPRMLTSAVDSRHRRRVSKRPRRRFWGQRLRDDLNHRFVYEQRVDPP